MFDAAQISALLYGCESWVGADVKPIIKLYNWCMKELLGVRRASVNSVCYAELGYSSLPDIVRYRQHKFYYNVVWQARYEWWPLVLCYQICQQFKHAIRKTCDIYWERERERVKMTRAVPDSLQLLSVDTTWERNYR